MGEFNMSDHKPISIIIPVYNVLPYLRKCFDSVVAQTVPDWEMILVDDGSTDGSGKLCDELAAAEKRAVVIHQRNQGLSQARNAGIQRASGDFILFLDSDDSWDPDLLEKLMQESRRSEADLILFPLLQEDEDGKILPSEAFLSPGLYSGDELLAFLCKENIPDLITSVNRLYRRDLWKDLAFPAGKYHEDEFVAHRIYRACSRILVLSGPKYHYLRRQSSITGQINPIKIVDALEAFLDRYEILTAEEKASFGMPLCRKILHYYLTLLDLQKALILKHNHVFLSTKRYLSDRIREKPKDFSKGEKAAVRMPALWQAVHQIRHKKGAKP